MQRYENPRRMDIVKSKYDTSHVKSDNNSMMKEDKTYKPHKMYKHSRKIPEIDSLSTSPMIKRRYDISEICLEFPKTEVYTKIMDDTHYNYFLLLKQYQCTSLKRMITLLKQTTYILLRAEIIIQQPRRLISRAQLHIIHHN